MGYGWKRNFLFWRKRAMPTSVRAKLPGVGDCASGHGVGTVERRFADCRGCGVRFVSYAADGRQSGYDQFASALQYGTVSEYPAGFLPSFHLISCRATTSTLWCSISLCRNWAVPCLKSVRKFQVPRDKQFFRFPLSLFVLI